MLSFHFYSADGQVDYPVRVSEGFYEWLVSSPFSQVGRSQPTCLRLEGEEVALPLISLGNPTRSLLTTLFNELIVSETTEILRLLDEGVKTLGLRECQERLKQLLELLNCVKNSQFVYLQRE
jgi:hypothetical protein